MASQSTKLVLRGLFAGAVSGALLLTGCASAGGGDGETGFSAPKTGFANQQSFGTSDLAQTPGTAPPADPWPRDLSISNAAVLVYQPQINSWNGNKIDFRAALAIKPSGAQEETFGVVFASARAQVDKVTRTVVFENLRITKSDFPTLPERGAAYVAELQASLAAGLKTISLDRLQASLAASGIKPSSVPVLNAPPQIIVSYSPAILVPIDGPPVLKPVADYGQLQRAINTRALILTGGIGAAYYLHVYDGWLTSTSIGGPWTLASPGWGAQQELDNVARQLSAAGKVDLLDGGPQANPKPSLANGVPTIYTAQGPAELVIFNGQPDFLPIDGTPLLWASNSTNDVLINTANNDYYVLLAGRWFRSAALSGPWTFVASNALPPAFAQIPASSKAAAVLASVAGTPQAQEAIIANSIPQTASVPLSNGPTFTPSFDGPPQYAPIAGTPLSSVVNSSVPIIQAGASGYYAVSAGVWFSAPQLTGPWVVASAVPDVIYTIPASSPLHYVTYVRIYEATPAVVFTGYTPGYLGTVVDPSGTVVYGTGYYYSPWIGSVWYPAPVTYTVAAVPVYNPYVGFTFGFAMGLATAAWASPYYGGFYGAYYHPAYWGGYPCCASASANVYGHWGNTVTSGTRSWYAGGGVAGSTASGNYFNQRTGTSGSYAAGRQFNAYTGNYTRGYDRTVNTAAGGYGNVARASNDNVYTGQRSTGSSVSGTGADGSSYQRSGATTAGPDGYAHAGQGSTYNANTGKTNTWNTASVGNNHYADVNGNVYRNTGDGWQQHSSGGWSGSSSASSWGDRESAARSFGDDRFGSFVGADHSGGGLFGGDDRFGGGFGGDRFGGGGFSGGRFGGGGFGGGGFRGGRR
ncbi:MAG: hypothetical protein JNM42_09285 [Propionivibrio sp.]|uniref:hypothetical protein n=1 Tax=Propionivibrio sp. TaxID=2212460 RepID=UPI001A46F2BE|nr:hypothetical protein [Propionivibrio sp.]MBL8414615.1 hypothetical protein [Propionivibrio sp.]